MYRMRAYKLSDVGPDAAVSVARNAGSDCSRAAADPHLKPATVTVRSDLHAQQTAPIRPLASAWPEFPPRLMPSATARCPTHGCSLG